MQKSLSLLIWISILGTVLFTVSLLAIFFLVQGKSAPSSDSRPLLLTLSGSIMDGPGKGALVLDAKDLPPLLTEYTALIRAAAMDPAVDSLVIEIDPLELGWASVQELADALGSFRAQQKPCTSTTDTLTNKEYILASACGEIHLSPAGLSLVNGLSITQTYFADTLALIGVKSNFEHVGAFKSAVEPFERTSPSPEAQEAQEALLDGVYAQFISRIAAGRGITEIEALSLVDDPPLNPTQALDRGLVDALTHREEVLDHFAGEDPITFKEYLKKVRKSSSRKPYIAVLHAEGTITSGKTGSDFSGDRYVGDKDMVESLQELAANDDVVAVVLRVNSPGGSGLASDNIWAAVQQLREEKPIVVSMSDLAASGGYYIAMGTDAIIAEPGTLTGSIGVFGGKVNVGGLLEKVGIHLHKTQRGEMADLLSMTDDFSDEGREKFRSFLQGFYELFLERVAAGREMSTDDVHAVAQGRVWTGEQALERGLVDQLGGLDVAIERARELAGVTEPTGILRMPEPQTLIDEIMDDLQQPTDGSELSLLLETIPAARLALQSLYRVNRALGGNGAATMLPYALEIR